MNCFESPSSREVCDKILKESEELILEHGVLSFTHSSIIKKQICSARTFYKHFTSREDILVCSLLRHSITYDVENFLRLHQHIPANLLIFAPSLLSVEISKQDPVYVTACLSATNCGIWKMSSDDKVKTLRNIEGRYYFNIQSIAEQASKEGYLLCEAGEKTTQLADTLYYYSMGKIFAIASTVSKYRPIERMKTNELEVILAQVRLFPWKSEVKLEDINRVYSLVLAYLEEHRKDINCERCLYFKSTQDHSMDGICPAIL